MTNLPPNVFFLLLFLLLYCLFFISYFLKKKYVFLLFIFCFIIFYDFVFITISPLVSPSVFYVIKSWQEYLTVFLLLVLIISQRYRISSVSFFDTFFLLALVFLTVVGFVGALMNGAALGQAFLGWRMYLLPFLWSFLLYKTGVLERIPASVPVKFIVIISVVIVGFAVFQDWLYQGNLKNLWFYEYINKLNPIVDHEFDFVRGEQLRATSIFVSPLILSSFLSFGLLILMYYILFLKNQWFKMLLALLLFAFLLYGQVLTRTRIGFITIAVGMATSIMARLWPSVKFLFSLMLPIVFAGITFVLLILGVTEDLSALGRLVQYADVPTFFVPLGLGFGSDETNVLFDSYYISVTLLFGIFTPVLAVVYAWLLKKVNALASIIRYPDFDRADRIFYYALYGFSFSFIYTFAFHFTAGSATIQIFIIMLFYFLSVYLPRLERIRSSQAAVW